MCIALSYQITFDVFVMVMLLANAVNRPYRESSEILENLRKDGIKFLAVSTYSSHGKHRLMTSGKQALLTIRSINFVLTIFSKVNAHTSPLPSPFLV